MARERLSMRKINEVLRLRFELKRSHRQIAHSIGAASSTVADYLRRFAEAGLSWPLSAALSEADMYPVSCTQKSVAFCHQRIGFRK